MRITSSNRTSGASSQNRAVYPPGVQLASTIAVDLPDPPPEPLPDPPLDPPLDEALSPPPLLVTALLAAEDDARLELDCDNELDCAELDCAELDCKELDEELDCEPLSPLPLDDSTLDEYPLEDSTLDEYPLEDEPDEIEELTEPA